MGRSAEAATSSVILVDAAGREPVAEREALRRVGAVLDVVPCADDAEAIHAAENAQGILCVRLPITRAIIAACPDLRVIVRYGIGFDNVDLEAATEHGVVVCNVTDYCLEEVADHTIALLLACNRGIVRADRALRAGLKTRLGRVGDLREECVGLVGFGSIARKVALRAQALGLRVIAHDPYVATREAEEAGVALVDLVDLLPSADYVSLHLPLNAETRHVIGAAELTLMKATAYLLNTSRGGLIDEHALEHALEQNEVAGAGIDVWEDEPVSNDNPLLRFESVVATPHVAFFSVAAAERLSARVGEAAADVLSGQMPRSVVNREVLKSVSLSPRP